MKNTTQSLFKLSVVAAAVMAMGSAYATDEVAELTTPDSSISLNAGQWSGDRHQQGIYDGQRAGDAFGSVDLDIKRRDDQTGTWVKLQGSNLGQRNQELSAEWSRQGDMGVTFDYSRTPRVNPYTFNTGLQGIGTNSLVVSGTTGVNTLPKRDVTLGTVRESYELGFSKAVEQWLDVKVNFKTEEKTGTRQTGMGGQPYFAVEPIDSTTNQLDASISYKADKLQLSMGYWGSQYVNRINQIMINVNGVSASPAGANPAYPQSLSVPMDNQAHQIYLNGAYAFTKDTKGTFKVSFGTATQNEDLSVASNLTPFGAPSAGRYGYVTSLNGQIDTTLVEASLLSRVTPKLTVTANARYYDLNDKTPLFGIIGTGSTATVWNTPTSYKTQSGKVEAVYRLPESYSLLAGIDYKQTDRSVPTVGTIYVPYRNNTDETNYRLQLRKSMSETINGSISYVYSERGGSPFITTTAANAGTNTQYYVNANSPFHLADRKRDKLRGTLDWTPADTLSVQFVAEYSKDRYDLRNFSDPAHAPFTSQGMVDGAAQLYSVDANYAITDNWSLNSWYSYEHNTGRRLNYRQGTPNAEKDTTLEETSQSFGLGVRGQISGRWQVGANANLTFTTSTFDQYVGTTRQALNDIDDRLTRVSTYADYAIDKNQTVRIMYMHELWRTNDWTYQFANGSPFIFSPSSTGQQLNGTDGTTVLSSPNQSNDFVGVRYTYKFQ